jgi:hypothetical protein
MPIYQEILPRDETIFLKFLIYLTLLLLFYYYYCYYLLDN